MPHTIVMQGISTFFASAMAVVVVTFPTPRDLMDTVFPPGPNRDVAVVSGGVLPDLPNRPANLDLTTLNRELSACVDSLSAAVPFGVETCQKTISVTGIMVKRDPGLTDLRKQLDLATAHFCRVQWVEASTLAADFDLGQCEGIAVALAN